MQYGNEALRHCQLKTAKVMFYCPSCLPFYKICAEKKKERKKTCLSVALSDSQTAKHLRYQTVTQRNY